VTIGAVTAAGVRNRFGSSERDKRRARKKRNAAPVISERSNPLRIAVGKERLLPSLRCADVRVAEAIEKTSRLYWYSI
jgi:hypothetical protein